MPQLEQIDTYLSQVVWLVISFVVLYVVMWKTALPRVADVLQERQERIGDDLERAEKLKSEAEAVLEVYEATTAKAQADAQAVLRAGADAFAAERQRHHAVDAKCDATMRRTPKLVGVQQVAEVAALLLF